MLGACRGHPDMRGACGCITLPSRSDALAGLAMAPRLARREHNMLCMCSSHVQLPCAAPIVTITRTHRVGVTSLFLLPHSCIHTWHRRRDHDQLLLCIGGRLVLQAVLSSADWQFGHLGCF